MTDVLVSFRIPKEEKHLWVKFTRQSKSKGFTIWYFLKNIINKNGDEKMKYLLAVKAENGKTEIFDFDNKSKRETMIQILKKKGIEYSTSELK